MKKILLVDDHELIYTGLKNTIPGYEIHYSSYLEEAVGKLEKQDYYALILDISIGYARGFELLKWIPDCSHVFFLSMHKSPQFIKQAKESGAKGYFLKDEPVDLLLEALRNPEGRTFWMSENVESVLQNSREEMATNYDALTPREQQIFSLLAQGMGYSEIARLLNISKKTVNNHRDHIYKKLEISSQTQLVHEALKLGILDITF